MGCFIRLRQAAVWGILVLTCGLWGCAPVDPVTPWPLASTRLPEARPLASLTPDQPGMTPTPPAALKQPGPGAILFTPTPLPPTPTATLAPTTPAPAIGAAVYKIVGYTGQGYAIEGWEIGSGPTQLIWVGGMHGGYEWNTIQLGYRMLDYFNNHPEAVPSGVTLFIIPSANPDGQWRVTGTRGRFSATDVTEPTEPGRFNANGVDLNRNWDCNWSPTSEWGRRTVSGGAAPFSEAETYYLKEFILDRQPALVIFWHSKIPGIFMGTCNGLRSAETYAFSQAYAQASGYPLAEDGFTEYHITGEASDYLSTIGIPSFTVELATDNNPEWEANLAGVQAILSFFR